MTSAPLIRWLKLGLIASVALSCTRTQSHSGNRHTPAPNTAAMTVVTVSNAGSGDVAHAAPTQAIADYLLMQRPAFNAHTDLSIGQHALTEAEFNERPWLWGQTQVMGGMPILPPTTHIAALDDGTPEARVRAIAERYLSWGRVDDELRFAPILCRFPQASSPTVGSGQGPHGQKVYFLYARAYAEYRRNIIEPRQVVVKESWVPHPTSRETTVNSHTLPIAAGEHGELEPGSFSGLFMMFRAAANTPAADSDEGWLYGTISPNGAISAGRLVSCMNCHRSAPHNRLFGLPAHRPNRMGAY